MYYVYLLKSEKDNGFYIGRTRDLRRRFAEHNAGKSLLTKERRPFKLLYYEAFQNKKDSIAREEFLKSGYGREQLNQILKNSLAEKE